MRATSSIRLWLLPAALMLAACEDSDSPFDPSAADVPAVPGSAAETEELPALADARWADGYAASVNATLSPTYSPPKEYSYNRAGGRITIQRPAGSTGRYIVTFAGLSAKLGSKSTVKVTAIGPTNTYCKPLIGNLKADKVEIRCTDIKTGASAISDFTVLVLRKGANRAFAFAHKPTAASYAPAAAGSYNPAGTMQVTRLYTGNYSVLFNGLGAKLGGKGGHVQVNAVGAGKAWCKVAEDWGGNPNLGVFVQCYTTGGLPVDAKFTVLFLLPSEHLAYGYANVVSTPSYNIDPFWSSNPAGGPVTVNRINRGMFNVTWAGVDPSIIDLGNLQVTALGVYDNANCVPYQLNVDGARVHCYAANGTPVDVAFTILLGS
jgi:hypothetical protein